MFFSFLHTKLDAHTVVSMFAFVFLRILDADTDMAADN